MGGGYMILKFDWNGRKMCQLLLLFSFSQKKCTLLEIHIFNGICLSRTSYTEKIIFLVKGQVQVMQLEAC